METYLDCIPCFIRQALGAVTMVTDDTRQHEAVIRKVLAMAAGMDLTQTPPVMAQQIHRMVRELAKDNDPYRDVKRQFTLFALKLLPGMETVVSESQDPIGSAVRLAIAGNVIDFGVTADLSEDRVEKELNRSLSCDIDPYQLDLFKEEIAKADNVLYLTDNAGEIVFDRLLIEQINPEKVIVAVKGFPVINDATREDARMAGLDTMVRVIDNGTDIPGTDLENGSDALKKQFKKADLIISKGQGNYETLSGVTKNIFFILKAKCPVIAKDLQCSVGSMILTRSRSYA